MIDLCGGYPGLSHSYIEMIFSAKKKRVRILSIVPFPNVSSALFPRWMCGIKATDLGEPLEQK